MVLAANKGDAAVLPDNPTQHRGPQGWLRGWQGRSCTCGPIMVQGLVLDFWKTVSMSIAVL